MTDAPMKVNFSDYVTPAVFYQVYSEDYSNSVLVYFPGNFSHFKHQLLCFFVNSKLKLKEKKPNKALMERMQSAKKKRVVPSVQLQKKVN